MRTHKLTTEELAKIVALQLWGISQQSESPMPYEKLTEFIEFYKKEFGKGGTLAKTLMQIKKLEEHEQAKKN